LRNVLASVVGAMFLLALLLPPTIGSNFGVPWNTFFPTALRGHAPFKRILAGSVMSAEILLAIAPRDCIAGVHQLAADTRYSMAWEQARDCPLVGAGAEQMLAVRPDLVITDEFTRAETQSLLARAGVVVLRTPQLTYLQDVEQAPMRFAELLPEECRHKVAVIMAETELRLAALARAAPGVAGWRVMTLDGALDTYGARSLVDDVIRAAGAVNVAAEHGVGPYRKLDVESVLAWRPDAIIVGGDAAPSNEVPEWLLQTPGLSLLPCVQKKRIVFVPGALLGSTSHHVVGAAEVIQAQLRRWGKP
jgi:iron complex transport system substrate-binding protein